jgi:hypothetical protein
MIGVYFESWACPWTNLAAASALAKIDKPIDAVFLSFGKPSMAYKAGQLTFNNTGLDFSLDFNVVKMAINILKTKGIQVFLAIGGATYTFDNFQPQACADLMFDLGCDGLDLDWEPAAGYAAAAQLGPIIDAARKAIGTGKKLSLAGFSTGCYDPNGDTFRGMNIAGLKSHGCLLDFVNIMAYDAGKEFSVIQCYESYKKYFSKTVNVGFEVGKQGWGDALLTQTDVEKTCRYIAVKNDGCFVWAYFKTGPPSAYEVCQIADPFLTKSQPLYPPPALNQFQCPQCKTKLTVT